MSLLFSLASAAAAAISSPVAADPAAGAPPVAAVSPVKPAKEKRYCIAETAPGSHMTKKTCMTLNEWRAQGVDLSPK
ncbi:MAG: hypothetical protein WC729_00300 [Sphingomonas sp.]|jgi:hypothetical protein|uniref:hypothetical protein n=1 Tax=Sphingomonas sp. TaxID=28214 RepID=UPI0035677780